VPEASRSRSPRPIWPPRRCSGCWNALACRWGMRAIHFRHPCHARRGRGAGPCARGCADRADPRGVDAQGRGVEHLSALYRPDRFRLEMTLNRVGEGDARQWEPALATGAPRGGGMKTLFDKLWDAHAILTREDGAPCCGWTGIMCMKGRTTPLPGWRAGLAMWPSPRLTVGWPITTCPPGARAGSAIRPLPAWCDPDGQCTAAWLAVWAWMIPGRGSCMSPGQNRG
jgi:hypothetical protein